MALSISSNPTAGGKLLPGHHAAHVTCQLPLPASALYFPRVNCLARILPAWCASPVSCLTSSPLDWTLPANTPHGRYVFVKFWARGAGWTAPLQFLISVAPDPALNIAPKPAWKPNLRQPPRYLYPGARRLKDLVRRAYGGGSAQMDGSLASGLLFRTTTKPPHLENGQDELQAQVTLTRKTAITMIPVLPLSLPCKHGNHRSAPAARCYSMTRH